MAELVFRSWCMRADWQGTYRAGGVGSGECDTHLPPTFFENRRQIDIRLILVN